MTEPELTITGPLPPAIWMPLELSPEVVTEPEVTLIGPVPVALMPGELEPEVETVPLLMLIGPEPPVATTPGELGPVVVTLPSVILIGPGLVDVTPGEPGPEVVTVPTLVVALQAPGPMAMKPLFSATVVGVAKPVKLTATVGAAPGHVITPATGSEHS